MKHQLHVSSMESLARCGIAYERRNIRGERIPPSARMVVGTAVDRSARASVGSRISDHPGVAPLALPLDEAQTIARDALVHEWENGVRLTEDDKDDEITTKDKAIDTSVSLARLHYEQVAPKLRPSHVARKFVLDVPTLSIQLAGEIDIQEGFASIRDTKTSGKSPSKDLAHESLQLSGYALAVRQLDGRAPQKVVLDYLVQTPKRKETKLVQLESVRHDEHLEPVIQRLAVMDKIIGSGLFTPAPIGAWWCARKYCGFWETCPYAARPVSVPCRI